MKSISWIAIPLLGIAILASVYWLTRSTPDSRLQALTRMRLATATGHKTSTGPTVGPRVPPSDDYQVYRNARFDLLRKNQAIQSEYESLMQQSKEQDKNLDDAMLRVDPKLSLIQAKLKNPAPHDDSTLNGTQSEQQTPPAPEPNLTVSEMQEVSDANFKALQSDPVLANNAAALDAKWSSFDAKLDAAVVQGNPALIPLVKQLTKQRQFQAQIVKSSGAK